MSRRQKVPSQRLVVNHDVTGTRGPGKPKPRTSVTQASTASSRAKEKPSRINTTHTSSKSASLIQISSNRSKLDPKFKRKVPAESEVFYSNLLLLGFDPEEISAKYRGSSIPFDKDMFQVPNMLAFQVVMHFLLNKLDTVRFHEEFRDCWPICDRKQEQAFRKACLSWLSDISDNEPDAHLPRLVPSLFLSPGGLRFYQLLLALTTYILVKIMKRDGLRSKMAIKIQHPVLTQKNSHLSDVLARTMKELIFRRRSNFFSSVQQSIIVHKECEQFANELVKEYRRLNDGIREKEGVLEKLRSECQVPLSPRGLDSVSEKRRRRIERVRAEWSEISGYYQSSRKERDIVSSIIRGTIDKHRLNASDYSVQVPDLLLKTCHEDIQKRNIGNTYDGGKMDLMNVLKLWTLSVEVLLKKARETASPKLEVFSPNLMKQVHDASSYLANVRSLKNRVNEVFLPELRRSITDLKALMNQEQKTPRKLWESGDDKLGFVPPTPPVDFDSSGVGDVILPELKGRTPPELGRTPEAARRIMSDVTKRAQRKVQAVPDSVSKLPKRLAVEASEDSQALDPVLWRVRQHSAPGATGRISTPTRPRVATHFTGRKNLQDTGNVESKMPCLKQPLVVRNVQQKVEYDSKNPTKPIIKSICKGGVKKDESLSQVKKKVISKALVYADSPKSSKERAEDKLIDQIVEAVTGGTPVGKQNVSADSTPGYDTSDLNLQDPVTGLDDAAFKTRDKLAHSPVNGSNSTETRVRHVQFSPNAKVQLESPEWSKDKRNDLDDVKCTPLPRKSSPVTNVYISPLPEFDSPIDIPRDPSVKVPDIQVHEPSPARLQALSEDRKSSVTKSPVGPSVPVLDLEMLSPVDDVMDASVELVDFSSDESDEKETSAEDVPTGNLIGFIPREPTPSCITPYKSQNDSCRGQNDSCRSQNDSSLVIGRLSPGASPEQPSEDGEANVLNSDERIEMVHQFEKSFEEKMLDMSLKVTGTPDYAKVNRSGDGRSFSKTSVLEINDDDTVGLPRTPISVDGRNSAESFHEEAPRITLDLWSEAESSPSPYQKMNGHKTPELESVENSDDGESDVISFPKMERAVKTNHLDIISRFRSLKLKAEVDNVTNKSPVRTVLTPDEDRVLDDIYLQQSPRQEPEGESSSVSGKFTLDVHFDSLIDSDTEADTAYNNKTQYNDEKTKQKHYCDDENSNRISTERVSFHNFSSNASGLLDLDADDILVPNSPTA